MKKLREKFFAKISQTPSGCIEWQAARNAGGYGVMAVGGKLKLAHHVSWFIKHGVWPKLLMHSCDNPVCVKPDHLSEGTHQLNRADCVAKGRGAKGERIASAKLTDDQVLDIRHRYAAGDRLQDLAEEYGLALINVWRITSGRQWKHVGGPTGKRVRLYDVGGGRRLSVDQIAEEFILPKSVIAGRVKNGERGHRLVRPRYMHA